jgi:hypothetical protein
VVSLKDSIPPLPPDEDNVDDLDDFADLDPFQQFLVVLDRVQSEYGVLDPKTTPVARVHMMHAKIARRYKLQAHAQHRSMKRGNSSNSSTSAADDKESLRVRAFQSVDDFERYWNACQR